MKIMMSHSNWLRIAFGAAGLFCVCVSCFGSDTEIVPRLTVRLDRLKNITVTFRQETTYVPNDAGIAYAKKHAAEGVHLRTGTYIEDGTFQTRGDQATFDVEYAPETVQRLEAEKAVYVKRTVKSYSFDRSESFFVHSRSKHIAGQISGSGQLPRSYPIDIALGLRCYEEQAWLGPSRIDGAKVTSTSDGQMAIDITDLVRPSRHHVWAYDPNGLGTLTGYKCMENGFAGCMMRCSDFEAVENVLLPRLVDVQYSIPTNPPQITCTVKIHVTKYELTDAGSISEPHLSFPAGALVTDTRFNVPLRAATTRSFSDNDIYEAARAREARTGPLARSSAPAKVRVAWTVGSFALVAGIFWYLFRSRRRRAAE